MEKDEILNDAKMLLKIDGSGDDNVLMFIIDDCINAVLSYCRIDVLPYQLFGFISRMAAERYEAEILKIGGSPVSSVTEGDRKVDFSVPLSKTAMEEYAERLNPFVNRKGRLPSEINTEEKADEI